MKIRDKLCMEWGKEHSRYMEEKAQRSSGFAGKNAF